MHKAWKRHQNTENWVDVNLAVKKGLKIYQTRSNAVILHETLPAYCIQKVVRMETGEVMFEKVNASPRPPPKISLKHEWKRELGSEVALRPDGQVVQQSKSSQSNQPTPNPDHDDRTGQPVVATDPRIASCGRKTSRSQEIETRSFHEEAVEQDRTVQPVVDCDASHESGKEQTMLNEVNIDFRILGLQHSVVKQAESSRVRELVKKIENHPDRHALQLDLQQNEAYNPFSATTKKMIQDVGNVELFELFETDLETVQSMLIILESSIVYCTCGHLLKETVANRNFIVYTWKTSWPQIWESSRKQGILSVP